MLDLLCPLSLEHHLTMREADQKFTGDKRIVSKQIPTISEGAHSIPEKADIVLSSIAKAKNVISATLSRNFDAKDATSAKILDEMQRLKKENEDIKTEIKALRGLIEKLQNCSLTSNTSKKAEALIAAPKEDSKDEDFDLFGSDEDEDEEKQKIVEERLKAYAEKKAKKAGPIAKSSVILDVKPWDDETDLKELEAKVRSIEMDGLLWGGGKLIPIGYGINKLQIITVIEDAKVSVDDLIDQITAFEDHVQSVDIHAFNKI